MTLQYAVDRLYETGWSADDELNLETLPDGRQFPSVKGIEKLFEDAGLKLSIKHNLIFNCYHAAWSDRDSTPHCSGTVIGACEREAAVYALAQLRQMHELHHIQSPAMAYAH